MILRTRSNPRIFNSFQPPPPQTHSHFISVSLRRWRDSYDITLPAGYVVDETPDPVDVDMDFASYHAAVTAKGNVLHYEREYTVRQVELPAARAADFRKLEGAILFDEKGTAVLKKQ